GRSRGGPGVCRSSVILLRSALGLLKLHGELHDPAGAEPVRTELYEVLGVLERAYPARGLDLYLAVAAGAQQRHILARGPACRKARAGLYEVRAGVRHDAAEHTLFVVR